MYRPKTHGRPSLSCACESFVELLHTCMIFTIASVLFFESMDKPWLQMFKSCEPYYDGRMLFDKFGVKFKLHQ